MKFHLEEKEAVISALNTSENGLSSEEASRRLEANGKNALKAAKPKSLIRRFFEQLGDPMTIILLVAAAVSGGLAVYESFAHPGEGEGFTDVIIIMAVVLFPLVPVTAINFAFL